MPIITIAILYPNLQFQAPLEIRYYNLHMKENQVDYQFYTLHVIGVWKAGQNLSKQKQREKGGRDEKLNLKYTLMVLS